MANHGRIKKTPYGRSLARVGNGVGTSGSGELWIGVGCGGRMCADGRDALVDLAEEFDEVLFVVDGEAVHEAGDAGVVIGEEAVELGAGFFGEVDVAHAA